MRESNTNFNQIFNAKFNLGFVLRLTPDDLQKVKNFIESLPNVIIVHSHVSGNRLYIKEERGNDDQS